MDVTMLNEISDEVKKYNARLLPVIKGRETEEISKVYNEGFREFGENRLDELLDHKSTLKDCHFHFIAPLQSRKIPEILENSKSVHTVSRLKEVEKIDLLYKNHEIFVQINIDNEETKSGLKINELEKFLYEVVKLKNLELKGLMAIPRPREKEVDQRQVFRQIRDELINLQNKGFKLDMLSMGMSSDYDAAIKEGATMKRIGTDLFGKR